MEAPEPRHPAGQMRAFRPRALRLQLQDMGAHLVGCQETPILEDGVLRDGFLIVGGGQPEQQLGVSLLINMTKAYATGPRGPKHFRRGDIRVLHRAPRVLVVKIETCCIYEIVYVVHAPYKGHREIQPASWWRELSSLAEKWPPTILLGDCNANIPNHT
eukprot:7816379-Pyramimonas_sp.AAC.1